MQKYACYQPGLPSCNIEAKDPVPAPHVLHQSKAEEKKLNAVRIMIIIIYRYQVLFL